MSNPITLIGRSVHVDLPEFDLRSVPARVDTGARTSAIWASNVVEKDGKLSFTLFDKASEYYTGTIVTTDKYEERVVSNSFGVSESRYAIKLLVTVEGRRLRTFFTLANRSLQVYPILLGRNILRGKFLVDVKKGTPLLESERKRSRQLKQGRLKLKGKETS